MIARRSGIALLWLSLDASHGSVAQDAALLAVDELVHAAALRDPVARRRFVRRRALVRRLLGYGLGLPPGSLRFDRNARGKPRLAAALARNLHFSVSSAGPRLLVAIGRGWVIGTDLVSLASPGPPPDAWPLVFGREATERRRVFPTACAHRRRPRSGRRPRRCSRPAMRDSADSRLPWRRADA